MANYNLNQRPKKRTMKNRMRNFGSRAKRSAKRTAKLLRLNKVGNKMKTMKRGVGRFAKRTGNKIRSSKAFKKISRRNKNITPLITRMNFNNQPKLPTRNIVNLTTSPRHPPPPVPPPKVNPIQNSILEASQTNSEFGNNNNEFGNNNNEFGNNNNNNNYDRSMFTPGTKHTLISPGTEIKMRRYIKNSYPKLNFEGIYDVINYTSIADEEYNTLKDETITVTYEELLGWNSNTDDNDVRLSYVDAYNELQTVSVPSREIKMVYDNNSASPCNSNLTGLYCLEPPPVVIPRSKLRAQTSAPEPNITTPPPVVNRPVPKPRPVPTPKPVQKPPVVKRPVPKPKPKPKPKPVNRPKPKFLQTPRRDVSNSSNNNKRRERNVVTPPIRENNRNNRNKTRKNNNLNTNNFKTRLARARAKFGLKPNV